MIVILGGIDYNIISPLATRFGMNFACTRSLISSEASHANALKFGQILVGQRPLGKQNFCSKPASSVESVVH